MKRLVLAAAALLALATPALAQFVNYPATPTKPGGYLPLGGAQFALSVSSATALTVPTGAVWATICVEGQAVRYRDDGTNPTASTGMPIASGACIAYAGNLAAIKFIAQTGSPTIDVIYYQ